MKRHVILELESDDLERILRYPDGVDITSDVGDADRVILQTGADIEADTDAHDVRFVDHDEGGDGQ